MSLVETNTKDIFKVEDITIQINSMKDNEFPCSLKLYDRILQIASKDEARLLYAGIEVGWFLKEEAIETLAETLIEDISDEEAFKLDNLEKEAMKTIEMDSESKKALEILIDDYQT